MSKKVLLLLLVFCSLFTYGQEVQVRGNVTDELKEPLPGVSIGIKDTGSGTISDLNGNYSIKVSPNQTLVFSFIGYAKQEVVYTGQPVINVTLKLETELLEEVVVVGYGSQKKVNLTGAVATVNFDDKTLSRPVTTLASTLSGMVAGLNVMQTSSKPNSESSSLRIRGTGTLNDSAPLILVDGMEMSLNNVNPNDIASISILKDAASCAIYGNRGANGVILLTTRKGTDGKINVTYSGKFSYNTPANLIRMVSNYADYMEFINEASDNAGQAQVFSQTTIDKWREAANNPNGISESGYPNYVAYPNTDWYDEAYNPKLMQEHSITLIGAEKRTKYSINATYVNNPGLVVNSGMQKYYMRSNIESKVTPFLAVGLNAWGYHIDQERNNVDDLNGLQMQKSTPGSYPFYDGKYGSPEALEEDPVVNNPVYALNNSGGSYKMTKVFVNPYIKIDFLKNFHLISNFYYDHYRREDLWHYSNYRERFSFQRGESMNVPPTSELLAEYPVKYYIDGNQSWKNTTTLNWGQVFNSKHDVAALAGYEEFRRWARTTDISKKGMLDTSLTDFDALTEPDYINGSTTEFSSRSVFGRVTYAYDSRYLFEANVRYDGSSRFSPENRWGIFPSFSAGWRLSEEQFIKNLNWFDNLKLRASWGQLGNNSIGNYEWQAVYATAPHYAFGNNEVPGIGMGSFSNYNLEWETTTVTNLGVDFSVLNNRLSGTFEVYNKVTDGILYNPTLSPTLAGFSSPRQNIAEVTNKGLELTLGWSDRIGSLSYGISGNFSFNKNEVTKYKGELVREWRENADGSSAYYTNLGEVSTGDLQRVLEGHMINEFYVLNVYKGNRSYFNADGAVNPQGGPSDGMIRTEDDMEWLQAMSAAGYKFYPRQGIGKGQIWYGDIIYADMDGDGIYGDDDDKEFQGYSKTPKYYFGVQANLAWKGFDLSMNWAGAAGFKINWLQSGENSSITWFGYGIGKDVAYDHYFYDPNNPSDPRTNITSENPRLTMDKSAQISASGQHILHTGDYLKLKNLTVGYTLPQDWTKKIYMQKARVYVSGENLLTVTKFKGIDPEMMSGVGYAPMRQFAFGVNVTF
jgi:TonB-linked SusC/RagA family outer membrane protein